MITRKTRKLIGLVRKTAQEIAVLKNIDGKLTETGRQSGGYSVYDLDGKLIEEISFYRFTLYDAYRDVYFYEASGALDYREEYDENNALIAKSVFEKCIDGNLLEKRYYFDKRGKIKLRSHLIYEGANIDEEDSIIETADYDERGRIIRRHFNRDDTFAKVKKNKILLTDGYQVETFRTDEKNEYIHRETTVYDAQGNRKEYFCWESDGTLYLKDEFDYEFDSVGNWVVQIQNHWVIGWGKFNLVPFTITRRTIEYY